MPRRASAGASLRNATHFSAWSGSPAASKRAAEAIRESTAATGYYRRVHYSRPERLLLVGQTALFGEQDACRYMDFHYNLLRFQDAPLPHIVVAFHPV